MVLYNVKILNVSKTIVDILYTTGGGLSNLIHNIKLLINKLRHRKIVY